MVWRTWCSFSFLHPSNHLGRRRRACGGRQRQRQQRQRTIQRRGFLTESIEPPLNSTVPEKPCTVVLAETQFWYDHHHPPPPPTTKDTTTTIPTTLWSPRFRQEFPQKRGIHYCEFQGISQELRVSSSSSSLEEVSLESMLKEMEHDLSPLPSTIVIARGPLYSWIVPYYLESWPLAGVVLVDPLLLCCLTDTNNHEDDGTNNHHDKQLHTWLEACSRSLHHTTPTNVETKNSSSSENNIYKYEKEETSSSESHGIMEEENDAQPQPQRPQSITPPQQQHHKDNNMVKDLEYTMMKRILNGQESRPLHLEPGSVPMLVLSTTTTTNTHSSSSHHDDNDDMFRKSAHLIANRHSIHPGDVPVKCVSVSPYNHDNSSSSSSTEEEEEDVIDIICDWIDERVL